MRSEGPLSCCPLAYLFYHVLQMHSVIVLALCLVYALCVSAHSEDMKNWYWNRTPDPTQVPTSWEGTWANPPTLAPSPYATCANGKTPIIPDFVIDITSCDPLTVPPPVAEINGPSEKDFINFYDKYHNINNALTGFFE